MAITKKLKEDVLRYNINLPVSKGVKAQLKSRGINRNQYAQYLRSLVTKAKARERIKIKKTQQSIILNRSREDVYRNVARRNKILKTLQNTPPAQLLKVKNKLFNMTPAMTSFQSYEMYQLWNDRPDLIGITHTPEEEVYLMLKDGDTPEPIEMNDIEKYMAFYNVQKFLTTKFGHKVWLSMECSTLKGNEVIQNFLTSKARVIRNVSDIAQVFENLSAQYNRLLENRESTSYAAPFNIVKLDVHVAKVNSLTGSSYIELPDFIKNKKACINIKNEDQKCFLYSVMCALNTPKKNACEMYHYKNKEHNLIFKETDMPMDLNKIQYFEKRNNLRINVYGIENKQDIIPLHVSVHKEKLEFPFIPLLYFKNGDNAHYCYIKNLDALLSKRSSGNDHQKNLVCPYCCEFKSNGGSGKAAMEKHMSYCIPGQTVEMPVVKDGEQPVVKFRHFSNINECPIRIYADFETFNDASMRHSSKNEKTTYSTGHKPASFKILVVSDIYIDGYEKVDKYYSKSIIYKGSDADNVFIHHIQELETELCQIIYDTQFNNKYNIIMSEQQKIEHKACKSCWICQSKFTSDNKKVRHHDHNTGLYHSALCSKCNVQIKDTVKIPVFFHNLNYDKNVFFTSLVHYKGEKDVKILPDNSESFKAFTIGKLHFFGFDAVS